MTEGETIRQSTQPDQGRPDPLKTPANELVKTPLGRYAAKQEIAVIIAARLVGNGVLVEDATRNARRIFSQGVSRKQLAEKLVAARSLTENRKPPTNLTKKP